MEKKAIFVGIKVIIKKDQMRLQDEGNSQPKNEWRPLQALKTTTFHWLS
jgi:hypothetical protein